MIPLIIPSSVSREIKKLVHNTRPEIIQYGKTYKIMVAIKFDAYEFYDYKTPFLGIENSQVLDVFKCSVIPSVTIGTACEFYISKEHENKIVGTFFGDREEIIIKEFKTTPDYFIAKKEIFKKWCKDNNVEDSNKIKFEEFVCFAKDDFKYPIIHEIEIPVDEYIAVY